MKNYRSKSFLVHVSVVCSVGMWISCVCALFFLVSLLWVITAELSVILSQPHIALKQETLSDCFQKRVLWLMYLACTLSVTIVTRYLIIKWTRGKTVIQKNVMTHKVTSGVFNHSAAFLLKQRGAFHPFITLWFTDTFLNVTLLPNSLIFPLLKTKKQS